MVTVPSGLSLTFQVSGEILKVASEVGRKMYGGLVAWSHRKCLKIGFIEWLKSHFRELEQNNTPFQMMVKMIVFAQAQPFLK